MKFDQLAVLLPCESLENLDLQRSGHDSEQLLAAWSAVWHPSLVTATGRIPRWFPASSPPDPAGHLVVVPDCCEASLPEGWLGEAEATDGAKVLSGFSDRNELLAVAFEAIGGRQGNIEPVLAADFLALGYCYLQVELLTRKLRYMSNLDESALQTAVLAAAEQSVKGDAEATREQLQAAFDRLYEAREYFYPTEARLLDLTLVAPTTLGPALEAELCGTPPRNLLISGQLIEEIAQREPGTIEAMKSALSDNRVTIVGGEYAEGPLSLVDPETIEQQLRRGLAAYRKHLQWRPTVFGRRRFGLTPALPQILARNGFTGALHFTLDDGRFPAGNHGRIQWEGLDGTTIEAVGCVPIDAGQADSFLQLAETLGSALNIDSTPTLVFAHWPGRASPWYDDLRRISTYGSILGGFATATDYFDQTSMAGQRNTYGADEYRPPYLTQDVAGGICHPISRWPRYFRRCAMIEASRTLAALATLCGSQGAKGEGGREKGEPKGKASLEELGNDVEQSLLSGAPQTNLDAALERSLHQSLAGFAKAIVGTASSVRGGTLLVNPWSFAHPAAPASAATADSPLPLEVPAMGFAWFGGNPEPPPPKPKGWFRSRKPQGPPPLAETHVLRNEFFEIHFDPRTGGIRAISDYRSRDPRLAQQIALREPRGGDPAADANYTRMAGDELRIVAATPLVGEMLSCGRLMDHDGRRVAAFRQTTRVRRGSRIIELEIELEADRQPGASPWDCYYAARFAWKDEAAVLRRSVNMISVPTELRQFDSPHFIDIVRDTQHTTLLTGGLPYHRRIGPRRLDTLLITAGEDARKFRVGIALDPPSSMAAAAEFIAPPLMLPGEPSPPTPTGWLFHLDCRNVLATHWEALGDQEEPDRVAGFRVRLLETEGRGVPLGLRCFRELASAMKINYGDVPSLDLVVEGDRINVAIGPHQWIEVEARFA